MQAGSAPTLKVAFAVAEWGQDRAFSRPRLWLLRLPGVLLALIPVAQMPTALAVPRNQLASWAELEAAFRDRGVAVLRQHPRCSEAGLYGLYVRGRRSVVVCERGDRSNTLRHEGWHLVQSLCLSNRPWLEPRQIQAALSRQDRRDLGQIVSPANWWREAEARAMARLSTGVYLQQLDRACRGRLPQSTLPAPASQGQGSPD